MPYPYVEFYFFTAAAAQTPSNSSFRLLIPSSGTARDDDDDPSPQLLNRRVGHSPSPSITINIKSMNLGLVKKVGEEEEDQEGEESAPTPRNPLKRSAALADVVQEEVMADRHSKKMLVENEQAENSSCSNTDSLSSSNSEGKTLVRICCYYVQIFN